MFNIDEEEAKKQVDNFLASSLLNYVLVYLILNYFVEPVLEIVTKKAREIFGRSIVAKFLKK